MFDSIDMTVQWDYMSPLHTAHTNTLSIAEQRIAPC